MSTIPATSSPHVGDLWPPSIRGDSLSPKAILQIQAGKLTERTHGRVEGRVQTHEMDQGGSVVRHVFEMVAPSLSYTSVLLTATHRRDAPYPVKVESEHLAMQKSGPMGEVMASLAKTLAAPHETGAPTIGRENHIRYSVYSEENLLMVLGEIFKLEAVVETIQSMVARTNDLERNST